MFRILGKRSQSMVGGTQFLPITCLWAEWRGRYLTAGIEISLRTYLKLPKVTGEIPGILEASLSLNIEDLQRIRCLGLLVLHLLTLKNQVDIITMRLCH